MNIHHGFSRQQTHSNFALDQLPVSLPLLTLPACAGALADRWQTGGRQGGHFTFLRNLRSAPLM
ncbi:MAG: hypothetical protein IIB44_12665 [Candidatus Marinimicrobia bacterium]|nr:hypothetical protein [Candidatus Neomarinimicrobiota bacterium]